MTGNQNIEDVRTVLQKFQDGYKERNLEELDQFLALFVHNHPLVNAG